MNKYTIIKDNNVDDNEKIIIVKKSKFIAKLYSINSKEEAEKIIKETREKYKDAKHVVYAYTLQSAGKFSDDKEPQGTAGKPIYMLLEKENLVNVLILVIRYFGGTLLGAGPLTRTYLESAKQILGEYVKEDYIEYKNVNMQIGYSDEENILKKINDVNGKIIKIIRDSKVQINANIPSSKKGIFNKYIK